MKKLYSLWCVIILLISAGCNTNYNDTPSDIYDVSNAEIFLTEVESYSETESEIESETESSEQTTVAETTTCENSTVAGIIETTTCYSEPETTTVCATTETVTSTPQHSFTASYAGLYNALTMECLYSKASTERVYPASLTKLLTACTALNYVSPDKIFTVGTELSFVADGSSLCMIHAGHRLKLRDLLAGMLMCSGNDAAYTVAVNVAREVSGMQDMSDSDAVSYFCRLMNNYARSIGAVNSNFVSPDGWDNDNQYSTVYDLALISARALNITEIRNIVSCKSKYVVFESGETITWKNTNLLLHDDSKYYLPQAIGMKTGSTAKAGKSLIAVVNVNGREYIAVVMGCENDDARYESVHELIKKIR